MPPIVGGSGAFFSSPDPMQRLCVIADCHVLMPSRPGRWNGDDGGRRLSHITDIGRRAHVCTAVAPSTLQSEHAVRCLNGRATGRCNAQSWGPQGCVVWPYRCRQAVRDWTVAAHARLRSSEHALVRSNARRTRRCNTQPQGCGALFNDSVGAVPIAADGRAGPPPRSR